MEIRTTTLEASEQVTDEAVVVIDVLRSFTTAAVALAAGARAITLAESGEAGLALRDRIPGALTVGAAPGGRQLPGFELGNSPAALRARDLAGREVVMCTAGGVRGVVRCGRAAVLLAGSLVCAAATARYLRALGPPRLTLLVTGTYVDRDGDEDFACADYLAALLRGGAPDPAPFERRVRASDFGRRFGAPRYPQLPLADLEACAAADRFDFALPIARRDGRLVIERG